MCFLAVRMKKFSFLLPFLIFREDLWITKKNKILIRGESRNVQFSTSICLPSCRLYAVFAFPFAWDSLQSCFDLFSLDFLHLSLDLLLSHFLWGVLEVEVGWTSASHQLLSNKTFLGAVAPWFVVAGRLYKRLLVNCEQKLGKASKKERNMICIQQIV